MKTKQQQSKDVNPNIKRLTRNSCESSRLLQERGDTNELQVRTSTYLPGAFVSESRKARESRTMLGFTLNSLIRIWEH